MAGDIRNWKIDLMNDFEATFFLQHPELNEIKSNFYEREALYASMSGSGSAVYGIFQNDINTNDFHFPSEYLIWKSK
jgi:4-diphosphocytidyl-2-C-methyl-D-erythritol kinase